MSTAPTYVYFIRPVGMEGPIKVGSSVAPDGRRATLDTWSPYALEIVAQIEGDIEIERRFHALFLETHQRREWFGWSRRIAATIAAINDGSFDIATLPAPMSVAHMAFGKSSDHTKRTWSPARRFATACAMRAQALKKRGMPWAEYCAGPSFHHYAYSGGAYADRHPRYSDVAAQIRLCEAFADAMTEKYGHHKMKPVRWIGPFPTPPAPAQRIGIAA